MFKSANNDTHMFLLLYASEFHFRSQNADRLIATRDRPGGNRRYWHTCSQIR
jgi:hypothetical protein